MTLLEYRPAGGECPRAASLDQSAPAFPQPAALPVEVRDTDWYQRAVFYEVIVRSFADGNGDGVGDLTGLTGKLDYLAELGVDCLWLAPFYPSPMRDGGYDVTDHCAIDPALGTLEEFIALLRAARERGIKILIDFVLNHTSDQHPWFQCSRTDPTGPYGDFYTWSDTDTGFADAPVIFPDVETSNWAYDPVRGQYYWHRFFSHQPDLNFDNPAVRAAILDAMRFWLDLGVDGLRLDAVPYLFAREGTSCAHLPETHEFLREMRRIIDAEYPGRILLGEANGSPEQVAEYFGDGDECQMAFHFPLMPQLFMAERREDRAPISEVLAQSPTPPKGGQWGVFLRNHDELSLETVHAEDRAYLWKEYVTEPQMRANLGIRRRLAPLLQYDLNRTELFTALLFSLPGSPVLYYGDEIGMGDNTWLGDRDGVRTPMQWSADRNGGFSQAEPERIYLPLNIDPVHGYQARNVEAQERNPSSLLAWTRRMIAIRKENPVFGLGDFEEISASNTAVLSFIRQLEDDTVLCVNNLSSSAQPVDLDINRYSDRFRGCRVIEMLGGGAFPKVEEGPYRLTLAPHGFYWLRLA